MDQVTAVSFEDTREVMERLGEITAPTLVLWGDQNQWIDPAAGARLAAAIPGAPRSPCPGQDASPRRTIPTTPPRL